MVMLTGSWLFKGLMEIRRGEMSLIRQSYPRFWLPCLRELIYETQRFVSWVLSDAYILVLVVLSSRRPASMVLQRLFTPSVWRWHGGKSSRTSHVQISATMVRYWWKFGCLCFMRLWLASKGLEDWLIVVSSAPVHRGFTHQILAYFEDFVPLLR